MADPRYKTSLSYFANKKSKSDNNLWIGICGRDSDLTYSGLVWLPPPSLSKILATCLCKPPAGPALGISTGFVLGKHACVTDPCRGQ